MSCRIVGDNIDYTINARIQSKNNRDQSLHWTHQYAVLSRAIHPSLDNTKSQKRISDIQLVDLLPNKEVQQRLKNRWAVLVSRVICKYITPLKQLQDVVLQHLPHTYSNEMAQKSTIVSCFFIILFGDLFNLYNYHIIFPAIIVQYVHLSAGRILFEVISLHPINFDYLFFICLVLLRSTVSKSKYSW